jgi:hypothetical protein
MKMKMVCSSEILVDILWTTQCYILEDRTLHRLTVFEYRMLRRIFGFKGEEVKMRSEKLHVFISCTLQNISRINV